MRSIGIRELRQNASQYVKLVGGGEPLCVTERGRPVAILTPVGAVTIDVAAKLLHELVAAGVYPDDETALEVGVAALARQLREKLVDQAVVESYTTTPQEPDPWVDAAARHALGALEDW